MQKIDMKNLTAALPLLNKRAVAEKVMEALMEDVLPHWEALHAELLAVLDEWRDKCLTEAKGVSDAG